MLIQSKGVTFHHRGKATEGYTLFSTIGSDTVRLIDLEGNQVHQWQTRGGTTNTNMLLPNGNLWVLERGPNPPPIRVAASGRMCEYDWDGHLIWEHLDDAQHHDARRLPNGGAVYLAWRLLDPIATSKVRGGVFGTEHKDGIMGEVICEVDASGNLVWEWPITNLDISKYPLHVNANRECYGHSNTVDVLPDGNYLVSFKTLNLLVIINRQTDDLIWTFQDDDLGGQHDAQMLDNGNILVFANGMFSRDLTHSTVWEIDPENKEVVWKYAAKQNALSFFSSFISGCQRLPSGNTLICEGSKGCLFEVTPNCDVVWEYVNPYTIQNPKFGETNWIFRSRRYMPDSLELKGRV
ncbi:MAG: arylsulfotransferase family protein [Chloroflexota bacterium]